MSLFGEAQAQQGVDDKGGVADPHVPVVPVPFAAGLLGEAGGWGGDYGPGWLVGEQLKRQRRTVHGLAPAAPVTRRRKPAPPEGHRGAPLFVCFGVEIASRSQVAVGGLEHEHLRLALDEFELCDGVEMVDLERHRRSQRGREVGRTEQHAVVHSGDGVGFQAVAKPRGNPGFERQGSAHA